jgi:tRNA U38,U39,U40 pseudouridine synthase TruA
VEELRSALEAQERKIIPYKADPDGLYLEDVIYE